MDIRIAAGEDKRKVFDLRVEVFVKEQNVPPEIELDAEDAHATHIIAVEDGICVGCARLLFGESDAHIGRFAVKKTYRDRGVGSAVCKFIVQYCKERGYSDIWLNSQLHASGFYEKNGFWPEGESFWEAGIEHVKMVQR